MTQPIPAEKKAEKITHTTSQPMPNFLIVGGAKAGTTALHAYLEQHPRIYMSPVKETNFFALEGRPLNFTGPGDDDAINDFSITSLEAYQAQFEGVTNEKAVGEASPLYLYDPQAPGRIAHYLPDAKIVVILRHPVERAYASFLHLVRDEREPFRDFARALEEEDERVAAGYEHIWHYRRLGFYAEQLSRYYERFPAEQIKVYLQDDLKRDAGALFRDLFAFLEVDPTFVPDTSVRHNVSGIPKNRALHAFLRKPNPVKSLLKPLLPQKLRQRLISDVSARNLEKPPLDPKVEAQLAALYAEDIGKLQGMLGRDLSHWLAPRSSGR